MLEDKMSLKVWMERKVELVLGEFIQEFLEENKI